MGNELYQNADPLMVDAYDDIIMKLTRGYPHWKIKTLLVCGSDPGVGATSVTIDLAIQLSKWGKRVLLIDGDMRKSGQHKRLTGNRSVPGLSDYLSEKASLEEIVNNTNHANLKYISCGTSTEHMLQLLGSSRMEGLIAAVYDQCDYILFDSPSLEAANDAAALAMVADGIFLVAEVYYSVRKNIAKAHETLGSSGKMLGVIVNKVRKQDYRAYKVHYDYFSKLKYLKKSKKKG